MSYDPKKAAIFNSLRQKGLSEDAAATQAGITNAEAGNYAIGSNGQMGPLIAGTGTVTTRLTDAELAENQRFNQGLASNQNFEQVDYRQTARSNPGRVTTNVTESVTGGGSTTIISNVRLLGRPQSTPDLPSQREVSPSQQQVNQYLDLVQSGVSQQDALDQLGLSYVQLTATGIDLTTPAELAASIKAADRQLDTYRAEQLAAAREGRPEPPPPPGYSLPGQTTVGDSLGLTAAQQAAARADPLGLNLTPNPNPLPAPPADNRALLTAGISPAPVSAAFGPASLLAPGLSSTKGSPEPLPTGAGILSEAEIRSGVLARTQLAEADTALVARNNEERRAILNQYRAEGRPLAEAYADPRYQQLVTEADGLRNRIVGETAVISTNTFENSPQLQKSNPILAVPDEKSSASAVSDSQGYGGAGGGSTTRSIGRGGVDEPAPVDNTPGDADISVETAAPRSFRNPDPVPGNISAAFDPDTQSWGTWNNTTGRFTQTGLSESQAINDAQTLTQTGIFASPPVPVNQTPANGSFSATFDPETGKYGVWDNTTGKFVNSDLTQSQAQQLASTYTNDGYTPPPPLPDNVVSGAAAAQAAGEQQQATLALARQQQSIREQRGQQNQGDWRVKLRLAPGANYLYKANDPGILWPLIETDGVIFPYTPRIDTSYRADYEAANLTHSNYRGYFYKNSYVDFVQIAGTFTAQDTAEAEYLLAVITFFKSLTKMFYGQDAQRGSPPPLVYLTGLGEYQFSEHPCVVSQFNYNLPDNVDYIRARTAVVNGTNLIAKRNRNSVPTNPISSAIQRLKTLGKIVNPGAINRPPPPPTLGINNPTYVPTKIDINLQLLPMQSRQQVSQQFSLNNFANGNLIKGGFW